MKKSIKTFLKIAGKDEVSKSSNPAIVRASTIYFDHARDAKASEKNCKR